MLRFRAPKRDNGQDLKILRSLQASRVHFICRTRDPHDGQTRHRRTYGQRRQDPGAREHVGPLCQPQTCGIGDFYPLQWPKGSPAPQNTCPSVRACD